MTLSLQSDDLERLVTKKKLRVEANFDEILEDYFSIKLPILAGKLMASNMHNTCDMYVTCMSMCTCTCICAVHISNFRTSRGRREPGEVP